VTADEIARSILAADVAPACAAGCAVRAGPWRRELGGLTELLFDLASVTKPMTAVAFACTGVARDTELGALLPEARGTASERASMELLFAHRAGLEAHRTLYAPLLRGESVDVAQALRQAADARRPDAEGAFPSDGFAPVYSDLGYVLAGAALARIVAAKDAGEAIERLVLEPLGIEREAGTVRGLAIRGVRGPFAPTETVAFRGGPVVGAVHDENAWALTGLGGSGQAGVFASVGSVLTFGAAVLDALSGGGGPFGDVDLGWLVRDRPGGTLRAGFDGKSSEGSSGGMRMSPRSFGHLGFTGTSLWIDPLAHIVVTLLTNRICPSRSALSLRSARPAAHDALWKRASELARS
jgi:CubicO group peptidase (beta-lactamase class C family)